MKDILEIISSDADIFVQLRSDTLFRQNNLCQRDPSPSLQNVFDSPRCALHYPKVGRRQKAGNV
jgi:hypothetical protein